MVCESNRILSSVPISLPLLAFNFVHLIVTLFFVLDNSLQILKHLSKIRLVSSIIPLEVTDLLSLIFIPICFIYCTFFLDLFDLFDFILVDQKYLSFEIKVLEIIFGLIGIIRFFKANESKNITVRTGIYTNIFNFTIRFEEIG